MISKWKMEMLAFLTSLTLVSVGFSSWQITGPVIENTMGSIQSEPVIKTDQYVTLSPTVPEYNAGGFIVSDTTITGGYKASAASSISLTFTLSEKCFGETSPFYISTNDDETINYEKIEIYCDITLRNNASSFFGDISSSPSPSLGGDKINATFVSITNAESEKIGYRISKTGIDLSTLSANAQITVSLNITMNDKSKIKTYLDDNEFIFNTQVYGTK